MTATETHGSTSQFVELSEQECYDRLAERRIGRVGWSAAGNQHILPVSYTVHAGQILFHSSPYGLLSQLSHSTAVAFEVDDIDERSGYGWRVLVQGRTEGVIHPSRLEDLCTTPDSMPRTAGTPDVFVAITPNVINGRCLRAPIPR